MSQTVAPCNSGIYAIVNLVNGKRYIGSSVTLDKRHKHHISRLENDKHCNIHLQRAFNKYTLTNFETIILEYIEDKSKLHEREQHWIDSFDWKRLYNIIPQVTDISSLKRDYRLGSRKPIRKYKKDTLEFIEEYDSLKSAAVDVGGCVKQISACALRRSGHKGRQRLTAYGFVWKYTHDSTPIEEWANVKQRTDLRSIEQYNPTDNTCIRKFKNTRELSKYLEVGMSQTYRYADGTVNKLGYFRYIE